jgi:hypothetical protein
MPEIAIECYAALAVLVLFGAALAAGRRIENRQPKQGRWPHHPPP